MNEPVCTADARRSAIGTSEFLEAGSRASEEGTGLLERILLSTDGTVVRLLECCFGEVIVTADLEQSSGPLAPTELELEPTGEETVLRRKVVLQGSRSGRNYVYAQTLIVLDRLHAPIRDDLLSTTEPIGRLLMRHRVETFREMLHQGSRQAQGFSEFFSVGEKERIYFRTYRIISSAQPVMLVTEYFPALELPPSGRAARGRQP